MVGQNDEKVDFISATVHELKTPLTPLSPQLNSSLMNSNDKDDADNAEV